MIRTLVLVFAAALLFGQGGADWSITLEPKAPLKADAPVLVRVTIKDAKGAPVAEARVELALTMVDMDHGETKFPASESGAGIYEAKPKFLMEGKWNIEVRARKGGASASTKKQVDVAE